MFASSHGPHSAARRRGIVLVLVLGMLGLMALIGVTFAAFAGQSLKSGRAYAQGLQRPQPEALMDFALAQLINDTNNPLSSLRGHSLLRDMYGNDSVFRGALPPNNTVADTGGLMSVVNNGSGVSPLYLGVGLPRVGTAATPAVTPFYNSLQYQTNIPLSGPYQGYDFTRWIIRFTGQNGTTQTSSVAQTFEILEDDYSNQYNDGFHHFTLGAALGNPTTDSWFNNTPASSSDTKSFIYNDPNLGAGKPTSSVYKNFTALNREYSGGFTTKAGTISNPFVLDGRFMRAFNGPGLTRPVPATDASGNVLNAYPYNQAANGNMRLAGYDPDTIGMDEDYDACDLENWFLAIQSADGQVMIPSFHRPGILTANDWSATAGTSQRAKILRPRQADNSPLFPADPSIVDATTGRLTYDIDNDGDGVTDSVWLDLGYPATRDPNGKLYKPLFAFMVLGLNGRLPLNTVGNLQARAIGDATSNGPDAVNYPNSTGQVPYPGYYAATVSPTGLHNPYFSSQVFFDQPLYDHTSHLGYSVNEINPKFALQNAPSNLYGSYDGNWPPNALGTYTEIDTAKNQIDHAAYTQYDDAGVSVALTQLRNILSGAMPTDLPNPYPASSSVSLPVKSSYSLVRPNPLVSNNDFNVVAVDGKPYILPNNMADDFDHADPVPSGAITNPPGFSGSAVARTSAVVPGRWGEPSSLVKYLLFPSTSVQPNSDPSYPSLVYNQGAGAGRSFYVGPGGTIDPMDDDFDGFDPVLSSALEQQPFVIQTTSTAINTQIIPLHPAIAPYTDASYPAYPVTSAITRAYPEDFDTFDAAGQMSIAAERARRFVTPQDTSGSGRMVSFYPTTTGQQTRPVSEHDYGRGADKNGRVAFFRYFRPAGMPQEVIYPYFDSGAAAYTDNTGAYNASAGSDFYNGTYVTNSGTGQRYLMPVLLPAGRSAASDNLKFQQVSTPDVTNNRLHGYQSALTPQLLTAAMNYKILGQNILAYGAMPYDFDPWLGVNDPGSNGVPPGYNDVVMDINQSKTAGSASTKGLKIQLYSPTINPNNPPIFSAVNTSYGPNLGPVGDPGAATYPIPWGTYSTFMIPDDKGGNARDAGGVAINFDRPDAGAPVVNGLYGGSLNKDEADEMNLYTVNSFDAPYGPSDLEWLYRKQDVDGSLLSSRLAQLAPVSFLNPADGLTRRRLFSTDSWDLINFSYANDNPVPYAGVLGGNGLRFSTRAHSPDHDFTYNSRFGPDASPSLEIMNQVVSATAGTAQFTQFANPITTEYLPNPTLPTQSNHGDSFGTYVPSSASSYAVTLLPLKVDPTKFNKVAEPYNMYGNAFNNAQANAYTNVIIPSAAQVQTPSVAHRDRKINLNYPLPISDDPAEPIRQKWCRETYQMLKAILPPASVDTPEELAELSQFVVNIVDFRDPDCSMTRFVNTDLVVTDVLTKLASTSQVPDKFDTTWTVSPAGVRFAGPADSIPLTSFPYDPSLYSPDTSPNCLYLVQHGMEYNPITINEAMAYSANYTRDYTKAPTPYAAMFIELVNTLTESQNNPKSNYNATAVLADPAKHNIPNSSAISLAGWDIVVLPDNYGWGRPDPISGDVNPVALPVYTPNTATGDITLPPDPTQWVHTNTTDTNWSQLKAAVAQYAIPTYVNSGLPTVDTYVKAVSGDQADYFIIGDYRDAPPGGPQTRIDDPVILESAPVAKKDQINIQLPLGFPIPVAPATQGMYYWVYLRRPANPFDTDIPNQRRPNKEMVVVDAMRFPVINATAGKYTASLTGTTPPTNIIADTNAIYSAQRLQPYRGGHLVAQSTDPQKPVTTAGLITTVPKADGSDSSPNAKGVTTICPPSPPYAYGYSEQMAEPPAGAGFAAVQAPAANAGDPPTYTALTQKFQQSINNANTGLDTNWAHFPFHDRDFNNVAELLLVPNCPPGLFTKQFVEEPYPGNIFDGATPTPGTAVGTDNGTRAFAFTTQAKPGDPKTSPQPKPAATDITGPNVIVAPSAGNYDPSQVARKDFSKAGSLPATPTYPYLSDKFYYTAASVSPPIGTALNAGYLNLTTEIGGWTGAGWHKMMEFFEVPSSANGAVGPAANGDNYDWARADLKPGLLNLNLIIDEEVFAGLLDDPRLNENLAALYNGTTSTYIPYVVNQIDFAGSPAYTQDASGIVTITGQRPLFQNPATATGSNINNGFTPPQNVGTNEYGRGYVYRDANSNNYAAGTPPPLQQIHGLKAAFSDFLMLRHGGSGYLFAHGAGDVGMGNFQVSPSPAPLPVPPSFSPIAADRPYRSLSYPDINYTIMRPASLPPAPLDPTGALSTGGYISPGTNPSLPNALGDLFSYNANAFPTTPTNGDKAPTPFLQLFAGTKFDTDPSIANTPLAPMNAGNAPSGMNYQYVQDPGIKNPYLAVQFANPTAPIEGTDLIKRALAPPYDAMLGPYTQPATPIAAPFPPPIPPTPARRLFQIPDAQILSNASYTGGYDNPAYLLDASRGFPVNVPVSTPTLSNGINPGLPAPPSPPSLVVAQRLAFGADNNVPIAAPIPIPNLNNFLGAGTLANGSPTDASDSRQHPVYRTEMIQKISNLTTVRTHQFATWITVGFFEVVATGTPELGIPDTLGGEIGGGAGDRVRYRAFFVIDRTKATGFNPYYPGNFRDCVTYRRRIE